MTYSLDDCQAWVLLIDDKYKTLAVKSGGLAALCRRSSTQGLANALL